MADITIKITCPVCEKDFHKKASELKDGSVLKCPNCGEQTTIRGNMFTEMAENINKKK
ncbi:MAG: hypothetical protein Q8P48_03020 [Deltaproteobacteria bacterium]|nr:hypothetical protein [Deltaproteobacteria bacterium]